MQSLEARVLQEEYRDEKGSVVGSDFYGATELLGLSDSQIVDKVVRNMTRCEPILKGVQVGRSFSLYNCSCEYVISALAEAMAWRHPSFGSLITLSETCRPEVL